MQSFVLNKKHFAAYTFLAASLVLGLPKQAQAIVLTYTFSEGTQWEDTANPNDGINGSFVGSFTFDTTTNTFTSVNISSQLANTTPGCGTFPYDPSPCGNLLTITDPNPLVFTSATYTENANGTSQVVLGPVQPPNSTPVGYVLTFDSFLGGPSANLSSGYFCDNVNANGVLACPTGNRYIFNQLEGLVEVPTPLPLAGLLPLAFLVKLRKRYRLTVD